jgi:hypothetical protein
MTFLSLEIYELMIDQGLCCTNLSLKAYSQYNFQMNKPTPKIYRTTNWSSYNRALINRGNIAIWFDPATQWYAPSKGKQGRNQTYSDAAIQCCLMIKSYFDCLYAWSLALFKVSFIFVIKLDSARLHHNL